MGKRGLKSDRFYRILQKKQRSRDEGGKKVRNAQERRLRNGEESIISQTLGRTREESIGEIEIGPAGQVIVRNKEREV